MCVSSFSEQCLKIGSHCKARYIRLAKLCEFESFEFIRQPLVASNVRCCLLNNNAYGSFVTKETIVKVLSEHRTLKIVRYVGYRYFKVFSCINEYSLNTFPLFIFNLFCLKLLLSQSKFSGTRKFYFEISVVSV